MGYPEVTPKFYHRLPVDLVKSLLDQGLTLEKVIEKVNEAAELIRQNKMGRPLYPWERT